MRGWKKDDDLKVAGTASPVTIGKGAARVHKNIYYWNTDLEYMEIPTPAMDARIDCIVLRTDWTEQTTRLARIEGIEGKGPPALHTKIRYGIRSIIASLCRWLFSLFCRKTVGAKHDIQNTPLAQITITTNGDITVKDTWVRHERDTWA